MLAGAAVGDADVTPPSRPVGPRIPRIDDIAAVTIPDAEARAPARFRLGLPLPSRSGPCGRTAVGPKFKRDRCPVQNASARHRVSCRPGQWNTWRHNAVARLLQLLILEIGGATVRWTPVTQHWKGSRGRGTTDAQPDLRVEVPGWRPLFLDVAITLPRVVRAGAGARIMEATKTEAYEVWRDLRRVTPADFSPVVFESYGRAGPQTEAVIKKLALERGTDPNSEYKRWIELLGTRLQLCQADMLLNS
jgi:hypothetical protein